MSDLVVGTNSGETLTAPSGAGENTKYDAKGGNDVVIGSTGNDLIIGGSGSDYLFGGAGKDTFEFGKAAFAGDTDYVIDFALNVDALKFSNDGGGTKIVGANAVFFEGTEFNGRTLANDSKVYDLVLTLETTDKGQTFQYTVTLMDVIKNQTFSADQFEAYLASIGQSVEITFGSAA